jgi:DNA-binding LacI/PurR family transcriptional regulator
MTRRGKVSRRDVAKAARVSVTAVTHALNTTPGIRMSEETREKIKRFAAQMGYRPSFIGRALVSGKNYMVGMLQPSPNSLFNPFYHEITRSLILRMDQDDYNVLLQFRSDEFKYMRAIEQGRVDGMIILQSDEETKHIDSVVSSGIPTIVLNIDYDTSDKKNVSCAHSDYASFTDALLADFIKAGRKKILAVIDYDRSYGNAMVCREIINRTGALSLKDVYITTVKPDWDKIREQSQSILSSENKWDGFFINSYQQASIFLEEAKRIGLKPYEDFTIIAGDFRRNVALPSDIQITTYFQDLERMAVSSWETLLSAINNEEFNKQIRTPYEKQTGTLLKSKEMTGVL